MFNHLIKFWEVGCAKNFSALTYTYYLKRDFIGYLINLGYVQLFVLV